MSNLSDSKDKSQPNSLVRMQSTSVVLREEWFVDTSFLIGDDGQPLVFVHQFVEYRTAKGNVKRRASFDIWNFDDEDAMAIALEDFDWSPGHDGDVPCLGWVPEGWEGATP